MSPRIKYIFAQEKKAIFCLIKKLFFVFQTIFKTDFIKQIIYCIIHRCLCSHFIPFWSFISVSKKRNIETMLTFPYSYNWKKLTTTTKWMKKKSHSMNPEYVTEKINSRILELFLQQFCCMSFALSQKSQYALVW